MEKNACVRIVAIVIDVKLFFTIVLRITGIFLIDAITAVGLRHLGAPRFQRGNKNAGLEAGTPSAVAREKAVYKQQP